jgi:uracil-DNA glycosylase family 4
MTAMNKYQRRRELAITIEQCHKCKDLNEPGRTEAAPGFGSIRSPVVIVGQSLCEKCMDTKVPFTGGSGRLIDDSLKAANLDKPDIFITNVVHCHPPNNRKSLQLEIDNCKPYLVDELDIISPKLVIGLGNDARVTLLSEYRDVNPLSWQPFSAPTATGSNDPHFLFAPHPSWILRQHSDSLERQYVAGLASALRWSFGR